VVQHDALPPAADVGMMMIEVSRQIGWRRPSSNVHPESSHGASCSNVKRRIR
jgi:hypothetical protein